VKKSSLIAFCLCYVFLLHSPSFAQTKCFIGIKGTPAVGSVLRAYPKDSNIVSLIWQVNGTTVYTAYNAGFKIKGITVAGGHKAGSAADQLFGPDDIYVDKSGALYVLDGYNNRVQKWLPGASSGTTVAGGNGEGSAANQLFLPQGFFVDPSGNIYIADLFNHRVQKWAPGATSGVTVAGGNGYGPAANQLAFPHDVYVDKAGNIYVTDGDNNRVQKWAPGATSGITVAGGNGFGSANNQLNSPYGLFLDDSGNIYISDRVNYRIVKWAQGATSGTMVAGGSLGSDSSQLNNPKGIYVDKTGAIYIADYFNNRIQKWMPGTNHGITVVGNITAGSTRYQFLNPSNVFVGPENNLYVADEGNNRVEKFIPSPYINRYFIPRQPGTYRVIASFKNGCADTSNEVVVTGTQLSDGINSNISINVEKSFTVFPNPAKQTATLEFNAATQEKYTIEITDLTGKKVLTDKGVANAGNNVIRLKIVNLASGIYIVNLINSKGAKQSIKLLKE